MTPEIVITVGLPGSGKSTLVKPLVEQGYLRLNRDLVGGTLRTPDGPIYQALRKAYAEGARQFVLDNTYMTLEHRKIVLDLARDLGLPVRALWLRTTLEQAQLFAARRQVQKLGRLLRPSEYAAAVKRDPGMFPPQVQYGFAKTGTPPSLAEGFASIEAIPVQVTWGPEYQNKAVILDLDGTLRETGTDCHWPRHPSEVHVLPNRTPVLQQWAAQGYLLLGASNQSGISRDPADPKYVSEAMVQQCIQATCQDLGFALDVVYATDRGGPPQSFWRKPLVGMGVLLTEKYKLDPAACFVVGDRPEDKAFAERAGCQFRWAEAFFGS